jgi:hypothetical protein
MSAPVAKASPQQTVAYLRAVRGLMEEATAGRRAWIRQVGVLILEARTRLPAEVAPAAARCALEQRTVLADVRSRLTALEVPSGCDECHDAFVAWLDKHLLACQILEEIGLNQNVLGLRSVQRVLADARADSLAFSAAYQALVAPIRARAAARKKGRRVRWPFGH